MTDNKQQSNANSRSEQAKPVPVEWLEQMDLQAPQRQADTDEDQPDQHAAPVRMPLFRK